MFEAYKAGLSALKKSQKDTSLEMVEGIVDEMQEAADAQQEISEAMGAPLRGAADDVDEDELERELKDLLEDTTEESLAAKLGNMKVQGIQAVFVEALTALIHTIQSVDRLIDWLIEHLSQWMLDWLRCVVLC